jgi:hypothetical protein
MSNIIINVINLFGTEHIECTNFLKHKLYIYVILLN